MSWIVTGSEKTQVVFPDIGVYYDAGNPLSYPGSGTLLKDLSGKNWDASLNFGATFNSSNGGFLTGITNFTPIILRQTIPLANTQKFSIATFVQFASNKSAIFSAGSSTTQDILLARDAGTLFFQLNNGADGSITGGSLSNNQWYFIVATYDGTITTAANRAKLFVNAVDVTTLGSPAYSFPSTFANTNAGQLFGGYSVNPSNWGFFGSVSVFIIYPSKTLNQSEINGLFNQFRSRYSL